MRDIDWKERSVLVSLVIRMNLPKEFREEFHKKRMVDMILGKSSGKLPPKAHGPYSHTLDRDVIRLAHMGDEKAAKELVRRQKNGRHLKFHPAPKVLPKKPKFQQMEQVPDREMNDIFADELKPNDIIIEGGVKFGVIQVSEENGIMVVKTKNGDFEYIKRYHAKKVLRLELSEEDKIKKDAVRKKMSDRAKSHGNDIMSRYYDDM
jgi:hypothetical protein